MTHELRKLLEEELAGETPPPLGDVVQVSVDAGRRVRRRRRLVAGAGGGATAAVLAVAGVMALGALPGGQADTPTGPGLNVAAPIASVASASASAAGAGAADAPEVFGACAARPTMTVTPDAVIDGGSRADALKRAASGQPLVVDPSAAVPPPIEPTVEPTLDPCQTIERLDVAVPKVPAMLSGGEFVTTTPESALMLLSELLPKGRTDDFAFAELPVDADPGAVFVQLTLDRGDGPGMLRLYVGNDAIGYDGVCGPEEVCRDVPGVGQVVLAADASNCIGADSVSLRRDDGVLVVINIASCLAVDGKEYPPAPQPLTVQEAVTIALHPTWGTTLPADLRTKGQAAFPRLTPIVGG